MNARILEEGFAYIAIPPDSSARMLGAEEPIAEMGYALVRLVRVLDAEQPRGWIVDLRADVGGYGAARWIGFHPFLVEGRLYGHAIPAADGAPQIVGWLLFRDGVFLKAAASSGGLQPESVLYDLGEHRYALRNSSTPVAVFAGSGTASAGENATLALRQNPRVRVFGGATRGATTAMSGFELEDGSLLLIAAAYMVDPSGHVFAAVTRAPWASASLLASGDCVAEPLQPDVAVAARSPDRCGHGKDDPGADHRVPRRGPHS